MFHDNPSPLASAWRNSDTVCALADRERHLGHILRIGGRWHAFDATHFNDDENGFRFLGTYASLNSAKQAVEQTRESSPLHDFLFGAA